jgi:hypothetical protein
VVQINDLSRSLAAFDPISTLVVVVEMSKASWLVTSMVPGHRAPALEEAGAGCDRAVAINREVAK